MRAIPKWDITTEEILLLTFGDDTSSLKSGMETSGMFKDLISMMKSEFYCEMGDLGIVLECRGIKFVFVEEKFERLYRVVR